MPRQAALATRAPGDWVSLGPASRLMGVDPDTLRRWADDGRVRAYATPGGHRRFSQADLERLAAGRRAGSRAIRRSLADLGATPGRVTRAYVRAYRSDKAPPALDRLEVDARSELRVEGRRLVAVLLAYLDATRTADGERWEAEALDLIGATARRLADAGATPTAAVAIYLRPPPRCHPRRQGVPTPSPGGHSMNFNVLLPLLSSVLSFIFCAFLLDQWLERRRPYQLIWAVGMLWYALSAGTEFLGSAIGWREPLYRAGDLIGAIWVAGWLGLGTVFLLAKTRFGYAFALSLGLAGLFTVLSWAKYDYPGSGVAPYIYAAAALILAIGVVVLTARRDERWVWLAGAAIVGGSVLSLGLVAITPLAAPGYALDPATDIPVGTLFPGSIRLLTPFFNVTGAFALTFGALYSTYVFMPKQRLI